MPRRPSQSQAWPGRIHRRGANVLFCDGHVEWYAQEDLLVDTDRYRPEQGQRRRMWNNDHEPNWE